MAGEVARPSRTALQARRELANEDEEDLEPARREELLDRGPPSAS
jgi:hypothetical protein